MIHQACGHRTPCASRPEASCFMAAPACASRLLRMSLTRACRNVQPRNGRTSVLDHVSPKSTGISLDTTSRAGPANGFTARGHGRFAAGPLHECQRFRISSALSAVRVLVCRCRRCRRTAETEMPSARAIMPFFRPPQTNLRTWVSRRVRWRHSHSAWIARSANGGRSRPQTGPADEPPPAHTRCGHTAHTPSNRASCAGSFSVDVAGIWLDPARASAPAAESRRSLSAERSTTPGAGRPTESCGHAFAAGPSSPASVAKAARGWNRSFNSCPPQAASALRRPAPPVMRQFRTPTRRAGLRTAPHRPRSVRHRHRDRRRTGRSRHTAGDTIRA